MDKIFGAIFGGLIILVFVMGLIDHFWPFISVAVPLGILGVVGFFAYHWLSNHQHFVYARAYSAARNQLHIHYAEPSLKLPTQSPAERAVVDALARYLPTPPQERLPPFLSFSLFRDYSHDIRNLELLTFEAETYNVEKTIVPDALRDIGRLILDSFPPPPDCPLGSAPLYDIIDMRSLAQQIVNIVFSARVVEAGAFPLLRHQLNTNRYIHSADSLTQRAFQNRERVDVSDFEGSPRDLVHTYFRDTSFEQLFSTKFNVGISERSRFEHMHIIAAQGHGKTQTLQLMIDNDLDRDASIIVIDPHGDLFNQVAHAVSPKKVIVVDPKDSPALNPFDVELPTDRNLTSVISLYEYFFGSLLGTELTAKQGVLFRYLAHLMLSIPGANLNTLIAVMDDPAPFLAQIEALPQNARNFLVNEFMKGRTFSDTREQVKYRLYDLIENPAFDRMFNAPRNLLHLDKAMDAGSVVLIHADAGYLEQKRASIFGRFFIAKALQAALQRSSLPESARRPTFLYVDEAWMFFDSKIDEFLDQARKFKLGLILAHQRMAQASPELQSSLSTTAIKLVGRVSAEDARALAPNMHTTPARLMGLSNRETHASWALYDRNSRRGALQVDIPFFRIEKRPKASSEAYSAFREANRKALTAPAVPTAASDAQEW